MKRFAIILTVTFSVFSWQAYAETAFSIASADRNAPASIKYYDETRTYKDSSATPTFKRRVTHTKGDVFLFSFESTLLKEVAVTFTPAFREISLIKSPFESKFLRSPPTRL